MKRIFFAVLLCAVFTSVLLSGQFSSQPVSYFILDGNSVPGFVASDRELAKWAMDAWSRESGGKLKFVEAKSPEDAQVRLRWVSAYEGLFGETQRVLVAGKEGAIVNVMPDVKQLGDPLAGRAVGDKMLRDTIVYLTCVHELGHAVGLEHTRNFQDIMYSFAYGGDIVAYFMRYRDRLKSRDDISHASGLSPADITALHGLYR